jgi:hypothetical protein
MPQNIEAARVEAQRMFLGRGPVVGVGVGRAGKQLVVMLEENSPILEHEICLWADQLHVPVTFVVTNEVRPV